MWKFKANRFCWFETKFIPFEAFLINFIGETSVDDTIYQREFDKNGK